MVFLSLVSQNTLYNLDIKRVDLSIYNGLSTENLSLEFHLIMGLSELNTTHYTFLASHCIDGNGGVPY